MLLAAALLVNSVSVPGTGLHVKLATQVGRPYDARTIENDVRWLWSLGRFDDVRVEEPAPGDLVFHVKPRERLVLRDARLTPHGFGIELGLKPGTPLDPLSAREIARGVERQLGYRVEETLIPRGDGKADLRLHVVTDKKTKLEKPSVEGIRYEVSKDVCRDLFRERSGELEFVAKFDQENGLAGVRGQAYRVGRIDITGNRRIADSKIRRHMLLDEGDPFDERRLRRSLARLKLDERSVVVARDPAAGVANITLMLPEPKRGAWKIAGPWPFRASIGYGPVSLNAYSVRRLPVIALFDLAPQLGLSGMAARYAISQAQRRLSRRILGEGPVEGPLRITGEADAVCIAKPRFRLLRTAASAALGFL